MRYLLLLLALAACGGGSSPSPPSSPVSPPPPRLKLEVGYYGGCSPQTDRTYTHVTLVWAMGWCNESRALTIAQAKQRGLKVVLHLPEAYESDDAVRSFLTTLQAQDLLSSVAYLYPADEPDLSYSAPVIVAANNRARLIAAEFAIAPKVAVIYAGSDSFPGIESVDVAGLDDYDKGSGVLGGDYNRLRSVLGPTQRLMLVPGGADPWRHDPAPWFAYARDHSDVVMVTPFLYSPDFPAPGVGQGIGSNGMASAYCREAIAFTGGTCP